MHTIDLVLPRDATALGGLRSTLRRWLAGMHVDAATTDDVVLAAHEAAANVVDHTDADWFSVVGMVDHAVHVVVSDTGIWDRHPDDNDERGRGFQIMRQLAMGCAVVSNDVGTTIHLTFPLPAGLHTGAPGENGRVAA